MRVFRKGNCVDSGYCCKSGITKEHEVQETNWMADRWLKYTMESDVGGILMEKRWKNSIPAQLAIGNKSEEKLFCTTIRTPPAKEMSIRSISRKLMNKKIRGQRLKNLARFRSKWWRQSKMTRYLCEFGLVFSKDCVRFGNSW